MGRLHETTSEGQKQEDHGNRQGEGLKHHTEHFRHDNTNDISISAPQITHQSLQTRHFWPSDRIRCTPDPKGNNIQGLSLLRALAVMDGGKLGLGLAERAVGMRNEHAMNG